MKRKVYIDVSNVSLKDIKGYIEGYKKCLHDNVEQKQVDDILRAESEKDPIFQLEELCIRSAQE